jgi:uncharacterized Fe-S cluster-containing protein
MTGYESDFTTGERRCKRQEVTHLGFATKCGQCGKGKSDDGERDKREDADEKEAQYARKERAYYSD